MRLLALLATCWIPVSASAGALVAVSDLGRELVAEWQFEEGAGTTTGDISGNSKTGTLSGSALPIWTNGVFGRALAFDGTNAYVAAGTSLLNMPSEGTISMWCRPTKNGYARDGLLAWEHTCLIAKDGVYLAIQQLSSNQIRYYYYDTVGSPKTYDSSIAIPTNSWSLVTVTWNSTGSDLYIDGLLDTHSSLTYANVNAANSNSATYLGQDDAGYNFAGSFDDVRFYSRLLSSGEVLNLYVYGAGRITP